MSTTLDIVLIQKYKNILNLGNISNLSGNTFFNGGIIINNSFIKALSANFHPKKIFTPAEKTKKYNILRNTATAAPALSLVSSARPLLSLSDSVCVSFCEANNILRILIIK